MIVNNKTENNINIEINEGFNIVYAKKCGRPLSVYLEKKQDVINFFINNLNNIELLTINDSIIDINKLVNSNILLGRYLKLKRSYEL